MTSPSQPLHHLTIHEAARLLKTRQLSPVELSQAFLDRIDAIDDRLKSYITLLRDPALKAAQEAEEGDFAGQLSRPVAWYTHRLEGPV